MDELMKSFSENTTVKKSGDGRCSIDCNKGLWGVNSPSFETAIPEALHYFQQYYGDGEYEE